MSLVLPKDLTVNQTAIWLDQQLFPGKPIYNTGQVLSIEGALHVDVFEAALRATIAESPGLSLPSRSKPNAFHLELLDFRGEREALTAAESWMRDEMQRPFDFNESLFRFALLRTGDHHWLWFQKYHHIIIDATGRRLLSERTALRYRALRFGEPLPHVNAATPQELLEAERKYLASATHESDRKYWLQRFSEWPGPLLEQDRRTTERAKSGVPARISFRLNRTDFVHLDETARKLESSAFRAIVALCYVAFSRLYDRSDLVLGLELAGRSGPRSKQTIGFFARPVPMLLNLEHTNSLADVLRTVEKLRSENYPHRQFPVQEIARELQITRKGHHSLFDIIINFIPAHYDFAFEDLPVEITNLSYGFTAPWIVTIADTNPKGDIEVTVDTDPGLVSAKIATQLTCSLELLFKNALDDLHRPIGSLQIMPQSVEQQALTLGAGEPVAIPKDATVEMLCSAQAQQTPDEVALIYADQQFTYGDIHARASRLARHLAFHGVRPGVIVGVALTRTPDLVVAVLAIHKAGGAYLALDPAYPTERIRFMVSDSFAQLIITEHALASAFADSGAKLVLDPGANIEDFDQREVAPARPLDLAYVLYTSGSTGRPKAVGIEHRNLVNLVSWGHSIVSEAELGGFLFSTSLNFDLSAFEIFVPLAFGGCLILVENLLALQSAPQRDKIRLINTGPSLMEALLRVGALPENVSTIILAGEKLSRNFANRVFQAAPKVRLLNCYGPTETTVYSSCANVDASADTEPTIGRPIWNTTLQVHDRGGSLRPLGQEGELYIGGAGVGRGYLGRPELTAERFVPNPCGPGRVYRTGDRVRWQNDGELEFFGRADDQIKIHGIRVEPGEIEAALAALPAVSNAVVKVFEDAGGVRRLAAFLVPASPLQKPTELVRAGLQKQLPRHMVPTCFVWLDSIPMTPNGKIDHKALLPPTREERPRRAHRAPETRLEHELAAIWEDLLHVSPIDVNSDFFDLGGDSLGLVSLFAAIEARFCRHLTVDVLAGGLTVAGLAQVLSIKKSPDKEIDPVVALQPLGDLPPFFCVHGIGGDVVHLHRLAMHMGKRRPFFGLRRPSDIPLDATISDMAGRYVDAMLVHQPTGPFYLGGHSFGAIIAYEIAKQLVEQGHEIGLLALLDQRRPGWRLTARAAFPVLPQILARIPNRIRKEIAEIPSGDRLRHVLRTLRRWSLLAIGIRADAASIFDLSKSKRDQIELFEANLRALRNYRPLPLRAPITLFRAREQLLSHLAMDTTLGWSQVAQTIVRTRTVAGTHGSITTEPFVQDLAKYLCDELDTACIASERHSDVLPLLKSEKGDTIKKTLYSAK